MIVNLPNRLPLPVLDAGLLTWHGKMGIIEASDLHIRPTRIFRDAIDVGFLLESPRTGVRLLMTLDRDIRDSGGDLIAEAYTSDDHRGIEVHVLND